MGRSAAATVENSFINGLVTEATALNFPEAAATETYNCVFNLDGSFQRRQGIDYESGYSSFSLDKEGKAVNTFYWVGAAGNGDYNLVVVQVGLTLYFYTVSGSTLSVNKLATTVNLASYLASGATSSASQEIECQFAYGKGYLFVAHPHMDPVYVTYTYPTTIASASVTLKIRDLIGVDDGYENDFRPTASLTTNHKYNLYNQGWAPFDTGGDNDPRPPGVTTPTLPTSYLAGDPLSTWDSNRTDWPSNADVWWILKDSNEVFQPGTGSGINRGNSPAPKGHFILNAFSKDRSTAVSNIGSVNTGAGAVTPSASGISIETSSYFRPKSIAFFAGRVWYAGVDYTGFNNTVYFSQVIRETTSNFGRCYQENDPTSEYSFDILATDGGTIQILDCGTITKLFAVKNSLVIFATNGVWTISGSTGTGFTPTDFSVSKISSLPCQSALSFVDVAGMPAWWTSDGIYILTSANQMGGVTITSLTEKKIKRFYTDEIGSVSKRYAKGAFNPLTKVIQWCYKSTDPDSISQRYEFDRVLCFNTITQAFYPWSVVHDNIDINGVVSITGKASSNTLEDVVDNAAAVVTISGPENVQAYSGTETELAGLFKYFCSKDNGATFAFTFAEEYDDEYVDWRTNDSTGVDYDSYAISGYRVRGDAQKKFQSNYIFVFVDTVTVGQFKFGGVWDYATSDTTNEFTSLQTIDTTSVTGRKYKFRKLKVRGMGISLQFKITSISGQPFKIAGWSSFDTASTVV